MIIHINIQSFSEISLLHLYVSLLPLNFTWYNSYYKHIALTRCVGTWKHAFGALTFIMRL